MTRYYRTVPTHGEPVFPLAVTRYKCLAGQILRSLSLSATMNLLRLPGSETGRC